MARIRTIKPEFPQSESMGRVSRDARLLFIMLWTLVDDHGRTRAAPMLLANLLFPYDDDARLRIPEWLMELERQKCVKVYSVADNAYLQIEKWSEHQRIDHPGKSKFPNPPESLGRSRNKNRESRKNSPRTKEGIKDQGEDQGSEEGTKDAAVAASVLPPEVLALKAYNDLATEQNWPVAEVLTDPRRSKLSKRLAESGGLEGWRAAMAKARGSPYLRGETKRSPGYETWTPNLDFFLQQSTFTKLMEGQYDQRGRVQSTGFDALREGARRAAGLDREPGQGVEAPSDNIHRLALPSGS